MLEPLAPFGGIDSGPARAGTERIEILVDVEVAQRVRRLIHIVNADAPAQHTARFVERGGDLVGDALLKVCGIECEHRPGNLACFGAVSQGKDGGPAL